MASTSTGSPLRPIIIRAASASSRSCRRSAFARSSRSWSGGVFLKRQQGGMKEWPGVQIIINGARIGASWANWYESNFKCGGQLAADRICVSDLDDKFDQYLASEQPTEPKALAEEIQRGILENYY